MPVRIMAFSAKTSINDPITPGGQTPAACNETSAPDFSRPCTAPRTSTVRVILGPQLGHFDAAGIDAFVSTSWRVGLDSDRVGARLDGPRLTHAGPSEIVSDGMVPGCIQVPPDGRPIVMLSDCPTTGGYPKIACVVNDDLGLVAQAIPGRTAIRFTAIRIEDV